MMVEIRSMGPQIGVEVTGVDVKILDDAGFAPIYQSWLDHNILVVRDQELEIEDFLRHSRRFGPVVPHPSKSTRHPQFPEITMLGINKFDADGKLNDVRQVKVAMTNASLFEYVADGRNGLRILQLTSPETMPEYAGFSPRPKPVLIATFRTKGEALAISKPLDRDRAVDEGGNQISVFGRRGARPFNFDEMMRMLRTDDGKGDWFTVTDAPQTQPKKN